MSVPLALGITLLELTGFLALATVVQVLASPQTWAEAGTDGLVGLARRITHAQDLADFVAIVGGGGIALLIGRGVAASALAWWQSGLLARAEAMLSAQLFRTFMGASYEYHLQHHSADLIRTVIQSVRLLTFRVLFASTTIVIDAFMIVGLATALLVIAPVPALVAIGALAGAMAMYLVLVRRAVRRIGVDDERLTSRDGRLVQEGLHAVKILTTLGRREAVVRRFEEARSEHAHATRGLFFLSSISRYYLEAVVLLVVAAISGVAIMGDASQLLTSVGVIFAGSMRLLPAAQRFGTMINEVRIGRGSLDQVRNDLTAARAESEISASDGEPAPPVVFERQIEIRELTYHYPTAPVPALDAIDLTVRAGESVGIVGASGSGKTTLVDVLLGLLPPSAGGIYVDGVRITPELVPGWRARIGYVPQDTVIVDDTVRRNVALGLDDADIDDAAVERAVVQAQLLDTVLAMPDGFDHVLGEHGVRLSGGQRQRIGIARALYRQPDVLVLDEATAALDTETEKQIVETIEKLYGKTTVFVIAHRLSTVQRCDIRVALDRGRISSVGVRTAAGPDATDLTPVSQ
ncbi:ABC transporter ATP-binding protein [Micromonospora sp. NPDC018662]|uniref:ABC transporter ATP-binding protein n=1 Tax=Micromonospora sp. NPDC018662 TaxID=3364238 RepID=UPI0037955238